MQHVTKCLILECDWELSGCVGKVCQFSSPGYPGIFPQVIYRRIANSDDFCQDPATDIGQHKFSTQLLQ
jgi:hypothetical protein